MATDDETPTTQPDSSNLTEWLGKRAGLLILIVIAAIIGLRLMSSWIKWMLIAMVAAAVVYLIKSAQRRDG
jgi:membrane protein implicated in regulation of membrane protease activity